MATITKTLLKRIAADLARHPLKTGEFRPIPRMGAHYISRESVFDGLEWLFNVKIDGRDYYIFYNASAPADACLQTRRERLET